MNGNHGSIGKLLGRGTVALFAGFGLPPALGQEPAPVAIEVSRCIGLEAPEERLACLDRQIEAAQRAEPPAPPPARAPEAAPPAVRPAQADPAPIAALPGTVEEQRVARAARRERSERTAAPEFTAKVTAVRETVPGAHQITLDNGQVWRQTVPRSYGLRPGHEVRLYGTRWGDSFRLEAVNIPGYIQVERVR